MRSSRLAVLLGGCVLLASVFKAAGPDHASPDHRSWSDYGGASDSAQYSALKQINRSNVQQLQVAWTYSTGDTNRYFFSPLMAHGMLYVLAKNNSYVALDASTGKEIWVHANDPASKLLTNRGLNYWESKDGADRRLLFASNNFLQAIDARTGESITSFGDKGRVDLRAGLGRDQKTLTLVQSTTPGRVFGDLLILGSATNEEYESAPGDVRAFDVRTGKQAWIFHTVPHPGEFGYETWPAEAWKTVGGANSWSELTLDEERGIVFVPTASPKYNFYGADRKGANLFGDCLLALDARTGKRLWHFQMVHHDIWDYDNGTAPELLTVMHNGKRVDVVAQAGKEGFVWVFNRVTGEPLWPIEERPVPHSGVPGEETWPTQPFPLKPPPFARQKFTADDLSPFIEDPQERARFRDEIQSARNEGLFTPPGLRNTIEMPGNNGGANWGDAAVAPSSGTLYVVSKDLPAMLKLEQRTEQKPWAGEPIEEQGAFIYEANCRRCHGDDRAGQPPAIPSLVHVSARLTPQQIVGAIRHGQGNMPAFPKLPAEEVDSLMAYLNNPDSVPPSALKSGVRIMTPAPGQPAKYYSGFGFMSTSSGVSPIAPPWTTLTAYDLNEGTIRWKVPLGEVPELAAKGFAHTGAHFPKFGPVVTGGGLIFTATRDRKVRALDQETGQVVWEKQLNNGMEGIPAVYEWGGREYLVVCAASQAEVLASAQRPFRGAYIAFALPGSRNPEAADKETK